MGGVKYLYYKRKYERLSLKLGFTIGYDCLGYGVRIPHYGTIVIGSKNRIGPYSCFHTSICITNTGKMIGKGFYVGSGARVISDINLSDDITVGANSVVNRSFEQNGVLLTGIPATIKKQSVPWYLTSIHKNRFEKIEKLKIKMGV